MKLKMIIASLVAAGVIAAATDMFCARDAHAAGETGSVPKPPVQTIVEFAGERPEADFKRASASPEVKLAADWFVRNDSHRGLPFMIADKRNGFLYAFDARGTLLAKSPALFGKTRSDVLTDQQAALSMKQATDADRVTPAGLFQSWMREHGSYGKTLVLAEYAQSYFTIHRVYLGNPSENRLQRLLSPTAEDNRISYGCINVPAEFISRVIPTYFSGPSQVIVLPERTDVARFLNNLSVATEGEQVAVGSKVREVVARSSGDDK